MTRLGDDCFVGDGAPLRLADALRLIDERIAPVAACETAPLSQALNRILATPVRAGRAVPPHDNSAVDGYAVYFDDLATEGPTALPVAGRSAAGRPPAAPPRRGAALRVFTGAALPPGADGAAPDTVFMQEDCVAEGGRVRLPPGIARGANRRRAGEDVAAGARVLEAGRRLRAEDLGLAASVGLVSLPVRAPLAVALFSTGDELREPGVELPAGAVCDANRAMLSALLRGLGCAVSDFGIVRDDEAGMRAALAAAARDCRLVVSSGGVSVGEEDHAKAALAALGGLTFWRLAIKPGRPLALGHIGTERGAVPFIGLPGNPAAAMVTFLLVARPLVLRLAGAIVRAPVAWPVRAGFSRRKKAGRREFLRCRLERGGAADATPVAVEAGPQGAGILSAVANADGLADLPEETVRVEAGDIVRFVPFDELR